MKKSDTDYFESLFHQFYPTMCMIATRYVGDEAVAKDIAQDTFIKLWRKRKEFDTVASMKSLLYTMVRNASLNYLRDQKAREIHHDKISQEISIAIDTDDNLIMEEETYRLLNLAVDNLPLRSAQIIRLSLQGLKNTEIADELNISVNTVKTLKYNAQKGLKRVLEGQMVLILLSLYGGF